MNRALLLACIAYLIWGFAALYWIETQPVSPLELVAHRALWSVPILALVLLAMGRLRAGLNILRRPRQVGILVASTLAQAANWLIFLYAVTHGQATEASLGYFLLPLVNVALGVMLFGESPDRAQWIAITLAGLGMTLLVIESGGLPLVALGVAVSFGIYGAIRKGVQIEPIEGLFVETLLLAPAALAFMVVTGGAGLGLYGIRVDLFLLGAGVITAVPLMCYVASARALPLSVMGLVFYLGPSCQLFVAICLFDEPLNPVQLFSFSLVWAGLAVVVADSLRRLRSVRVLSDD